MTDWDLIKIKADLLCMGLRPNQTVREIYSRQNPCDDSKTGNVGVHIVLNGKTHVLVTVSHKFDNQSAYSIDLIGGELFLSFRDNVIMPVSEVEMPTWYSEPASSPMPSLFLHEGKTFLHQAYSGCDFHSKGLGCAYCGAGEKWVFGSPVEVAQTVAAAVSENPNYHICLGGGTRLPLDQNVNYFIECAKEIRKETQYAPVWVEMTPPEFKDISNLVEAGVTSFGFNIEIWNDELRKNICPGKSMFSKEKYLGALKKAVEILGPNRVGSCLIVGLEPIESTMEGARVLASIGVQPCLLPFKPWDGSQLEKHSSCTADDLIRASKACISAMKENGIDPAKNQGCLHCESCTIDHDIYKVQ